MKKLRESELGRYVIAIARTVHPVRAIFEVCGTTLFAVPFLAAFAVNHSAPLYLYLLYPLLFLVSHFVWFRLSSVDRRTRWFLFWLTLTLVTAYFLVPSAFGAALYCFVLSLFLRVYKKYRAEEHRRRSPPDGHRE